MPLPLFWLGAAVASVAAIKELDDDRQSQQRKRSDRNEVQTLRELKRHESPIALYPSDILGSEQEVSPAFGAVVCCGIGGVLEHSGIWVGDNTIVELDGEGLIKPVSATRFTQQRSGQKIFIACDSLSAPLVCESAADRAINQLFQLSKYHIIDNNCHQFIGRCFTGKDSQTNTFKALNWYLAKFFNRKIYWDICRC